MSQYQIEITVRQESPVINQELIQRAVSRTLSEEGVQQAKISVVLVNDAEIHEVNRRFLAHDYPTDVISFQFDQQIGTNGTIHDRFLEDSKADVSTEVFTNSPVSIDGELIVSFETAIREADIHGWSPEAELLLYVVHGVLHLCGYDDLTDEARPVMRSRERELLAIWGFCPTGLEP